MDKLEKLTVAQIKKLIVKYNEQNCIKKYSSKKKNELIDFLLSFNTFLNNVMTNRTTTINIPAPVVKVKAERKKRVKKEVEKKEVEEIADVRQVPAFKTRHIITVKPTDDEIKKFNLKELNYFLHNNNISRREPIYRFNDFLEHNSAEIKTQLKELQEANFNEANTLPLC